MAVQTATTGQLENAQNVVIAEARYTMEHNAPCVNLVEHFRLAKGEKAMTIPKVAQMIAQNLTDGVEIVTEQDIGMTTQDISTGEVGMYIVITDKLARQENEDVFRMVGRQSGDGMGRKKDTDVIALYSALNGGTVLGADNSNMTVGFVSACIAWAKSHKLPSPIAIVHHPNAVYALTASLAVTPGATYPMPRGFAEDLLKDYWAITLSGVGVFHDGNIEKISGVDSGYGAIFSKSAMCVIESLTFNTERERRPRLRGTGIVVTADYGCYEIDDNYGAAMRYEIGDPATS